MKFEKILSELKAKKYKSLYLLMGEETYFIDCISDYIAANALPEDKKAFNQIVLYGKDTNVRTIDSTARRAPMMAKHQVVIVKEAQNIQKIDDLVYYAQNPVKSTILVINYKYKTLDKRKKVYKAISENGIVLESKKLYDNQVPSWITKYLTEKRFTIDPVAGNLLAEYLGNDLSKIVNELDKLTIVLPENTKITPDLIEKNIGISKDYNNFELHKAIIKRDVLKANRIIDYFGKNQKSNPIILTLISLYGLFSKVLMYHFLKDKSSRNAASVLKVNPYFVRDYELAARQYNIRKVVEIISVLREYDLKSKGFGASPMSTPRGLLKEMVFKIMH